jgi:hypothetical protein
MHGRPLRFPASREPVSDCIAAEKHDAPCSIIQNHSLETIRLGTVSAVTRQPVGRPLDGIFPVLDSPF